MKKNPFRAVGRSPRGMPIRNRRFTQTPYNPARIARTHYAGAEAILREVLSDRYDPNCRPAAELLAHLHQPGYFNKTITSAFIGKVEEVKQLLTEADGYYQSRRYDLAFKRYEQVLNLDPYNVAARRGQ